MGLPQVARLTDQQTRQHLCGAFWARVIRWVIHITAGVTA